MSEEVRAARPDEVEALIPLLLLAEESEPALRWSLGHMADAIYRMDVGGELVGAATLRWGEEPPEILEIAVAPGRQGQGLGRRLVEWLIEEARRRGHKALLVGTGNSSLGNIAFYQKCGMRMDHIRRDYFWYYRRPVFEGGIQKRDLIVLRYDLAPEGAPATKTRRR
jgi:GNAT superfamily N-acetyltransferase